ncbi:uncharacterized protein LOC104443927 isoform X7 [Eucalyptus grandis]|uniref:uncharacterized protein LOC104443927 isoform X7 n=1 Tax=Eucalyptus grandis TaxID=71139 RepID=UPI00192EEB13|nr:uncharacterized protein LOC104443927 isoform X7 [Eucalyptus grandis]
MLAGPHTKADAASNKHRSWKSPPASPQASICCVGIISRSDGLLLRDRSRDGGAVGEMQAKNPREATIRQGKCTERNGELRSSQGRRWQERRGKKNEDQVASQKLVVKMDIGDEEAKTKAKRVVWHIAGFERLTVDTELNKLTVSGTMDPVKVVNKLTKLHAEMVSFGAAKEDDGKKEGGKKNEDQVASQKLVVKVDLGDEEDRTKAKRVVWHIAGFERLTVDKKHSKLTVSGTMDPVKVVNKLTKLHAEMVSFGAAKEDDGKKEGGKKNEDQVASQKLVVKMDIGDEEAKTKAKRVVWHIAGFERLTVDTELNKLTVSGTMDPVKVVNKLTKLHAEMVSFGAAKEDDGKKEGGKKNEDQVASQKLVVKVDLGDEEDRTKAKRVVWHIAGFERLTVDKKHSKLTVSGTIDPVKVVNKLTKLHAEMVSFGAAKEDDGKKEGGKKNEDQVASQKLVVKMDIGDEEAKTKAKRVVWHIAGFERLTVDTELNKLTVSGTMDPVKVVNKLTKLHAEMVSFGAAKEDDGKKEGGKKNEDQVASQKLVVKVDKGDEEDRTKAKRVVWHIAGFERLTVDTKLNKLTASGTMDPVKVVNKLTKLHAEMMSFGAAKEDDGKKEGGKKNEDQVASQLVVKVDIGDEEDRTKGKRVVWHVAGFERLTVDTELNKLTVSGTMDPVKVVNKLTKLHAEMVIFGAAKEDDGKKEGGKKNEDQVASQLVVKVDLGDEEDRTKAKRVVWHIAGFERLTVDTELNKLTVSGTMDPVKVVNKLTKLHAEMVSFGAAKEDDGKKEGGKKNEDQVASQKLVVKVDLGNEEDKIRAEQVVQCIAGFERLAVDTTHTKLTVSGTLDPVEVVNKLRKSLHAEMVSCGAAKEDGGKKEGGKKNEDQVTSQKLVVKVDLRDEKDRKVFRKDAWKEVNRIAGFDYLAMDTKDNKLTVSGIMDPVEVVNELRESWDTEIVSFGTAKEDDGKKEEGKKNGVLVANRVKASQRRSGRQSCRVEFLE